METNKQETLKQIAELEKRIELAGRLGMYKLRRRRVAKLEELKAKLDN